MQKLMFFFLTLFAVANAHAKVVTFNDTPRIVPWNELSPEKIQELIHSKNSDFIVMFNKGATLPFQFLLKYRLCSAMLDPNLVLRVDETCYLRVVNKKCYMSENLTEWKKAAKFFEGRPIPQLSPSLNKPGFVVEANIVSYGDEEEES